YAAGDCRKAAVLWLSEWHGRCDVTRNYQGNRKDAGGTWRNLDRFRHSDESVARPTGSGPAIARRGLSHKCRQQHLWNDQRWRAGAHAEYVQRQYLYPAREITATRSTDRKSSRRSARGTSSGHHLNER